MRISGAENRPKAAIGVERNEERNKESHTKAPIGLVRLKELGKRSQWDKHDEQRQPQAKDLKKMGGKKKLVRIGTKGNGSPRSCKAVKGAGGIRSKM